MLPRARNCHAAIGAAVTRHAALLMMVDDEAAARRDLRKAGANMSRVRLQTLDTNDTWARDFGPLTVLDPRGKPTVLDFVFNGWGLKFPADRDNRITQQLHEAGIFGGTPRIVGDMVLEGGSIESDGCGTLLTTTQCLLSPNRNPHMSQTTIEAQLKHWFGATRVLWLNSGHLDGDDTDAHIDTLARLCPDDTIAYVACTNRRDPHYPSLAAMRRELVTLRTASGKPYWLIPLPMIDPIRARDGHRLPATYANFLVVNDAVLVPIYGQEENDVAALAAVARAFPGRAVEAIDCRPLIEQHGSLHCVTMQLPSGVIS